jgi:hypothetical protein
MSLANPHMAAQYRARTSESAPLNFSSRFCPGCKRNRSRGQWTAGADVCNRCTVRAVK